MKARLVLAVTLVLTVVLLAVIPAAAAATAFNINQQFPIDLYVYVPCANGGAGEDVYLSGDLHDMYTVVLNGNGGYSYQYVDNPMGISGTGLSTGTSYQATGITRGSGTGMVGAEQTYVNNFRIIGAGTSNNYLVHETFHITFNANFTLTAYVDNFSVECK